MRRRTSSTRRSSRCWRWPGPARRPRGLAGLGRAEGMPQRDPFGPWRTGLAFWTMMAEAQTVVAIRTMGIWGVVPASPRERHAMVAEKGPAFLESAIAAGQAAAMGQTPVQV